jgi:hypothetical protein
MLQLPSDLNEILTHEPRVVDVDQAERPDRTEDANWWRALVDTANCHDPNEIAQSLHEKGLSDSEARDGAIWLRPVREGEGAPRA